jgi:hypothetical protein
MHRAMTWREFTLGPESNRIAFEEETNWMKQRTKVLDA